MEELIVQLSARHGHFTEFVKSQTETMTLGRGFQNDVVLSDHFVAAEQLRFYFAGGSWKIAVLDTTNPVLINGKPVTEEAIQSGDRLTVGRSHLLLILAGQPLERTRKLVLSNWMYRKWPGRLLPPALTLVAVVMAIFSNYQAMSREIPWGHLVASGLSTALIIVIWAGIWALVGRVFRHQPNFRAQWFYSALMMVWLGMAALFSGYPEYISNSVQFGQVLEWLVLLVLLSLLLRYNLLYASDLHRKGLVAFAIVGLSLLSIYSLSRLEKQDFSTYQEYSAVVKPPLVKWADDVAVDSYLYELALKFESGELGLAPE